MHDVDDLIPMHHHEEVEMGKVRSRRPAVLQCLHAIDARRLQERRSWVVSFSILGPFGPRRATAMLRAGDSINVLDQVRVDAPYTEDACVSLDGNKQSLDRIRKIVTAGLKKASSADDLAQAAKA